MEVFREVVHHSTATAGVLLQESEHRQRRGQTYLVLLHWLLYWPVFLLFSKCCL